MTDARQVSILRDAMNLEHRGHAYYVEAALASDDAAGRKMFLTLAADELEHLRRLQTALRSILLEGKWALAA
jgi:rubrerythrin